MSLKTKTSLLLNRIVEDFITPWEQQSGLRKPSTPRRRILGHLHLLSSRFVLQGKIVRLSTLMVGPHQVQEINDMQGVIKM
jgi:hypothetical protein